MVRRRLAGRAFARALAGLAERDAARLAGFAVRDVERDFAGLAERERARAFAGLAVRERDGARRCEAGTSSVTTALVSVGISFDRNAGHALLLAAELARELGGVLVAQRLGERLDREVVGDLLVLVR